MKKQRKLSVVLATMLVIQAIMVTGCVDDADSVNKIETEITTESITQTETIQTESEKLEDITENNTQVELPDIVQTINEEDYKPFDITLDEFVEGYNYFAKQEIPNYEEVLIKDEVIEFYDAKKTGECNIYIVPMGAERKAAVGYLIIYCSTEDKNEILNIKYFTEVFEYGHYEVVEPYSKVAAASFLSTMCSINMDICYDNAYETVVVWKEIVEEASAEVKKGERSYRGYKYLQNFNYDKKNIEFDVIKE